MTNHFITNCSKWKKKKKLKAFTILFARYFTLLLQNELIIPLSHSSVELCQKKQNHKKTNKKETKAQLKHTQ